VDWSKPLLGALDGMGRRCAVATSEIRASTLPPAAAAALRVPATLPFILLIQQLTDDRRRPVMLAWDHHRGSHFSFQVIGRREL
jgi:DNA-binding GntR family transcriptional regulator